MSHCKKLISLLLTLILLATVTAFALPAFAEDAPAQTASDFVPVLRFIAASDTHVRDDSDVTANRIGKMLELVYGIADADPNYTALDALLIAGDLTNDGTKTEFDKFANAVHGSLREGTRFIGVVAKNHDGYVMPRKELRDYYHTVSGNDADFHVVINGYHFIGVSASPLDGVHYSAAQQKWLKEQLTAAAKEAPDKPIFVTHHEHVRGTVYGSSLQEGWGMTYFTSILKQFPQVVDFSGHSHYPLNDPRSLWQGKFTAVGTGAIYYSEFHIEGKTYHPADSNDTATCWIVEADADNRLRLRGMDVEAGACLVEYVLDNPADPANREYTPAKRKAAAKAPVFAEGTELTVTPTANGCTVSVPAAASADGMPVTFYRVKAVNKAGVTVAKSWTLPCYYRAVEQETVELTLTGLFTGEYTISVTAENAYGDASAPVTATVNVDDAECPYCHKTHEGFFGKITLFFHKIAIFFANLFGIEK